MSQETSSLGKSFTNPPSQVLPHGTVGQLNETGAPGSNARVGIIHTPHGDIHTPAFVPVATNGTAKVVREQPVSLLVLAGALKAVSGEEADASGVQLQFSNTYHLLVPRALGLHCSSPTPTTCWCLLIWCWAQGAPGNGSNRGGGRVAQVHEQIWSNHHRQWRLPGCCPRCLLWCSADTCRCFLWIRSLRRTGLNSNERRSARTMSRAG